MLRQYIFQRLRRSTLFQVRQPLVRKDTSTDPSPFIEENFSKHTLFVLDVGKRAVKFSLIGLGILGGTAAAAYEGLHLYIEKKELAPDVHDEEVERWEWDLEAENWSGDPRKGGTDPQLGIRGRHAVRSAWMALHWGVGFNTAVNVDLEGTRGFLGPGGMRMIDARLQYTEDFLQSAIRIAEKRNVSPQTVAQLVLRHANVLERLGHDFLPQAKSEYEHALVDFTGKDIEAARVAAKIGDLGSRLSQPDDALSWWAKAIRLTHGSGKAAIHDPTDKQLFLSWDSIPSSPAAQRVLSSVLVSLSAFQAKSGQLKQAQDTEEKALDMLRSIPTPSSLSYATPPQALHSLYLLQRSSLLSLHLAEVLYAQKKPLALSIQWLTSAAHTSERVACALSGLPLPISVRQEISPTSSTPEFTGVASAAHAPLAKYTASRSTAKVAHALLRDARRTSAEAWNLLGMLYEREGKNTKVALECYRRALDWAGTSCPAENDATIQAAESTLEADWDVYWTNYTRMKNTNDSIK